MTCLTMRSAFLAAAFVAASAAAPAAADPVQTPALAAPVANVYDRRSADAQPYPSAGDDNAASAASARAAAAPPQESRRAGRVTSRTRDRAQTVAATGGHTSNVLVAEARKYLGTNPTGRATLWCGAFMDLVLKRTGHKGGGNIARGYTKVGKRIAKPQVGAIAVLTRGKNGGHVGVVSGIDPNGNPIIVSGNHSRTVAEAVYPAGRVTAYVLPGT